MSSGSVSPAALLLIRKFLTSLHYLILFPEVVYLVWRRGTPSLYSDVLENVLEWIPVLDDEFLGVVVGQLVVVGDTRV